MQSSMTGAKKALTFVASIALALGSTVGFTSAANAADAGKVFINFESADTIGAAVNTFGGPTVSIVDAPAGGDGKAAEFTKTGEVWGGMNVILGGQVAYRLGSAATPTITMDVYADTASPIMVKLQKGDAAALKAVALTTGWNHLSVDMSTAQGWDAAVEYSVLALFPDFSADDHAYAGTAAVAPAGQKYDIDNISINGGTVDNVNGAGNGAPGTIDATSTLMTFETGDALGAAAIGAGFEGASTDIADAPTGGNGGKALKITKAGNAWSGVNLVTAPTGTKLMDATHTSVTLNYYSPETVNTPVQFQLSGGGSVINQAVEAAPGWSKLTFDFSASYNDAKNYTAGVIFPDFVNSSDVPGYTGAAAVAASGQFYYIDNVGFNGATTPAISVPKSATSTLLTWESSDALGALIVGAATGAKAQGGFEGAETSIAAAPAGGNGGNALKIVKKTGGATYAGVNMLIGADFRITDSGHKVVTFNYYSPKANSPVRIELAPWPVALGLVVTAKQGWQTLSFDLSTATGNNSVVWSADTEYVNLVLFPDFNATADDAVYYVDNFAINGATTPAIPVAPANVAPTMRTAASISGTAAVGKTLTASKGVWTGTPTPTYTYKWYRCTVVGTTAKTTLPTTAMKCVAITGGTTAAHKVVTLDKGKYLRVLVTAKNSAGTKYSLTKTTKVS